MASNKKSALLYCDLIHTVEKLSDEDAGQLFKHYLRYINDLDPKTDNMIVDLVFEGIKQSLNRDLKKWEERAERSRINGALGGRPKKPKKPSGLINNPTEPKKPDSVNVSVSVNDSVKVKDSKNNNIFSFKKSLIDLGVEKNIVEDYLKVRKLKKSVNSKTAFDKLKKEIEISPISFNRAIEICAQNSWSGFKYDWVVNSQSKTDKPKRTISIIKDNHPDL